MRQKMAPDKKIREKPLINFAHLLPVSPVFNPGRAFFLPSLASPSSYRHLILFSTEFGLFI
jgi:hypothetical protein